MIARRPTRRELLVRAVSDHVRSFEFAGRALKELRDDKHYESTHETFEAFCRDEWGFSSSRARQLIAAVEACDVARSVTNGNAVPVNERQARVLAALDSPQEQATVWAKAVETAAEKGKPVTASSIASAAKQIRQPVEFNPAQAAPDVSAAVAVATKPAEPNTIGALKHDIADYVARRLDEFERQPYVTLAVADYLEDLARDLRG